MKNKKENNLDKKTNLEPIKDSKIEEPKEVKETETKVIVNDNGTKEVVETSLEPESKEEKIVKEEPKISKEELGLQRAKKAKKIGNYIMYLFGFIVLIVFLYAFLFME